MSKISVTMVKTDDMLPTTQVYENVNFEKKEDFPHPETEEIMPGTTLIIWDDENANDKLDDGEMRAYYPPGTWTNLVTE